MTVPQRGSSWSVWQASLSVDDFTYLHDDLGNGLNLSGLSLSWFSLLGDSPVDPEKPYRVCSRFYAEISSPYGLPKIVREYAELGRSLLRELRVDDGNLRYAPLFREFAKTPIFRDFRAWCRSRDPELFSFILSFLWFGRKASYHKGDELVAKALNDWCQVEDDLANWQYPDHVLEDIRRLVALSGFVYKRGFWPSHGPRQVAERLKELTVLEKCARMRLSEPVTDYLYRLAEDLIADGAGHMVELLLPDPSQNTKDLWHSDDAEWDIVPKDEGSVRTICMEPLGNMYTGQAVLGACLSGLRSSKFDIMVDINDQSKNRHMATRGALFGNHSTIDLSSASDRMGWRLVSAVFPPELVRDMDDVRVKKARIQGSDIVIQMHKAFPMGSPLCFWTQSTLFSAVVCLAVSLVRKGKDVRDYLTEGLESITHFPKVTSEFRVFGDDIIVGEEYTRAVIILLEALGFKVNQNKSFSGNQAIRESCGVYSLCGADVTPLIFKVKGLEHDDYSAWLSTIAMANAAYDRGYLNLREALLKLVPRYAQVEMDSSSFYSNQGCVVRGNSVQLRHYDILVEIGGTQQTVDRDRWNSKLHRWERKVLCGLNEFHQHYGEDWDIDSSTAPLAQAGISPVHEELERYYYAKWIFSPSNTEGKKSPRDGLMRTVQAGWRWTPISE